MKKRWIEALAALVLALLVVMVLDRMTNRLDVVEGHSWDYVYYIDIAENGLLGNDHLGSPYAYRFLTPLVARLFNQTFNLPTYMGFRLTAYLGLVSMLYGMYLFGRHFKLPFAASIVLMLMPAMAMFNVKFLLFDSFRPDQLAYPLMLFAFLALAKNQWGIALLLSMIGLQSREYMIIPPVVILFDTLVAWLADRRNGWLVAKAALVAFSVGAVVLLPRLLIPITFTQQVIDPFNDPLFFKKLMAMPLDPKRDFNALYNILAYWMPLLILATPQRLKRAWQQLGRYRSWVVIIIAINLVALMYGGTDMDRFSTYFFIAQAFFLVYVLAEDVHVYEVLYLLGAMAIFNRLMFLFPIWNFSAYLDFYGGYNNYVNFSSYMRMLEVVAFVGLGQMWRMLINEVPAWRGMTLDRLALPFRRETTAPAAAERAQAAG